MKRKLDKRRIQIARILLGVMLLHVVVPVGHSMTAGPAQPEVQSFSQAGTSDMVDLFSGDFSYNIPLFEVPGPNGGYPFNLSYRSGIGMDQEASWVGLGWSLGPGSISRQVRGLPDEFAGGDDVLTTHRKMKPSVTVGAGPGIGLELFGGDIKLGLNMDLAIYNNNYTGVGTTVSGNLGYSIASKSDVNAAIGLGFSLDSKEGIMLSPNVSLERKINGDDKKRRTLANIGVGYHTREGLTNISYGISPDKVKFFGRPTGLFSSSISLLNKAYTPVVDFPMVNLGATFSFSSGPSINGIYPLGKWTGFANTQKLGTNQTVSAAYGYLNFEAAPDDAVLDFNRDHDGIIRKENSNLPVPYLTHDVYTVTGQGISAMFRPFRSDIGVVGNRVVESSYGDNVQVGVGIDVGLVGHVGVNGNFSVSQSKSQKWKKGAEIVTDKLAFQGKRKNSDFEPYYFKVHGEHTVGAIDQYENLGENLPVRARFETDAVLHKVKPEIMALQKPNYDGAGHHTDLSLHNVHNDMFSGRTVRSQSINPIMNGDLKDGGNQNPLYEVKYFTVGDIVNGRPSEPSSDNKFDRDAYPDNHIGAFEVTDESGVRYIYALPAYNTSKVDCQYSVTSGASGTVGDDATGIVEEVIGIDDDLPSNTDKFYNRTETSAFVHSHMLTAVLGPDYVDVGDDGVDDKDLGYWVKFTYTNVEDYQWRSPYYGGYYDDGFETDNEDNKASYSYGVKDLWYLQKVETKTHYADFHLEYRADGYEAVSETRETPIDLEAEQNIINNLDRTYALNSIRLYAKSLKGGDPTLIKTTRFGYDYTLCDGIPTTLNGGGKLTLRSLHFEYGQNTRGRLNPYEFFYGENRDYHPYKYDRWGNYKTGTYTENKRFPYVDQAGGISKESLDADMAAWSLERITTPSGGEVQVTYESDDYAYVHNKEAMQMVPIIDPDNRNPSENEGWVLSPTDGDLRVAFPLEKEIPFSTTWSVDKQRKEVLKYLDIDEFLYFRARMNLTGDTKRELVSGYVEIDSEKSGGMTLLQNDEGSAYTHGAFYVKTESDYNPFVYKAWQHIKTNRSELTQFSDPPPTDGTGLGSAVKGLVNLFGAVSELFVGFYLRANIYDWGEKMIIGQSWIRLKSPDGIKYGGGLRVKQIAMKDNWRLGSEAYYGQTYEYTTLRNGAVISSGVASYEPLSGGEENAMRVAKRYEINVPLHSNNSMFFEYPVNESYFPGAAVGYSKVTVKSLAADYLKDGIDRSPTGVTNIFPTGEGAQFGTTGKTVHEFYTTRDFPFIASETHKDDLPFNLQLPIPLLGALSISKLTTTQGYSIQTNDMHGKVKAVSNYSQQTDGTFDTEPFSYVRYDYKHKKQVHQGELVSVPDNVMYEVDDQPYRITTVNTAHRVLMGVEEEFFVDTRQHVDRSWAAGINLNLDIVTAIIPIPILTGLPAVSKSETELRSLVTNKVIFRSGILSKVEAYDNGSRVTTENLEYDRYTGRTLLSRVNNNFDAPILSRAIPAYHYYPGMGPIFSNLGLTFDININVFRSTYGLLNVSGDAVTEASNDEFYVIIPPIAGDHLYPGDVLMIRSEEGVLAGSAVYKGRAGENHVIYADADLEMGLGDYEATIVHSGLTNQVSVDAGNITSLGETQTVNPPNEPRH